MEIVNEGGARAYDPFPHRDKGALYGVFAHVRSLVFDRKVYLDLFYVASVVHRECLLGGMY